MSVSTTRNVDWARKSRFVQVWEDVFQMVPEARREAVKAAGEAIQQSLYSQIQSADFSSIEAKGRVRSWQQLFLGSGGGWAAVHPIHGKKVYSFDRGKNFGGRYRQHTWRGHDVTSGEITHWLELGHGTMPRDEFGRRTYGGYVSGRQFYAWTKDDALDIALKAADKVLCRIADEVDF